MPKQKHRQQPSGGSASSFDGRPNFFSSLSAFAFEELDSAWPVGRLQLVLRAGAAVENLARATFAARKHTQAWEKEYTRRKTEIKTIPTSGVPASRPVSLHSEWLVVDAQLLGDTMNALIDSMLVVRKIQREAAEDGIMHFDLSTALDSSAHAASVLQDLLFEKCRVAYERTFANEIAPPQGSVTFGTLQTSTSPSTMPNESTSQTPFQCTISRPFTTFHPTLLEAFSNSEKL